MELNRIIILLIFNKTVMVNWQIKSMISYLKIQWSAFISIIITLYIAISSAKRPKSLSLSTN